MIQLLSDDIWKIITSLAKKSKRISVAVAYFGTGASELLPLKKGDTLLVAIDINNVKTGQVNPFEVEKLYKKGVSIYNLPNLHAKIFLFDKKAIVGSANASYNSANSLVEAAILTDDKKIFRDLEALIDGYCLEKVGQAHLDLCKRNYRPPKLIIKPRKPRDRKSFKGQLSSLWVISTTPIDFDEEEHELLKRNEKIFKAKIKNKLEFRLTQIKFQASYRRIRYVKEGDIIVEIVRHPSRAKVLEPKRVLGVTTNKKTGILYLRVEERKRPVEKTWPDFNRALSHHGIRSITKNSTREIKNEDVKKMLWKLFQ